MYIYGALNISSHIIVVHCRGGFSGTGYLDFVAVFYPHVWQKMGRLSGPRRKKCRRPKAEMVG